MEDLLSKFYDLDSKICSLRRHCKVNELNVDILTGFSIKKMRNIYSRLEKHYKQNPQKAKTIWFQCELKLFIWILISYSFVNQKKIENFTSQDWSCFKNIFYEKNLNTFKYETKKIINKNCKQQRNWNSEQEQILLSVMEDQAIENKWNEVGKRFFELSREKYFRTGKQCRQHWLNHLDPSKRHGKWTSDQDLVILKFVLEYGKKWSLAYKNILPDRTEHMIKNRYKSLITKHKKKFAVGEWNEISIAQKIIAFYQRKQINETTTLKLIPKQTNLSFFNGVSAPLNEQPADVQNQDFQLCNKSDKVEIVMQEENIFKLADFTGLCFQCPLSMVWSAQYYVNPVAINIYCPTYYLTVFGANQNWSQLN